MSFKLSASLLGSSVLFSSILLGLTSPVMSQKIGDAPSFGDTFQFNDPALGNAPSEDGLETQSLEQVTNVNQLRDVSPADWAYEALRSLVDRYGCIAGFPNQTYRGNQALSRYEFAAGLNSCLNQIERLVASSEAVVREDIDTISRLTQEFEAELASLSGRVDDIESRTAFVEDNQFSTTTKLQGEVAFTLAQAFGDDASADLDGDGVLNDDLDSQVVFTDRVRLQLVSSFTGKDKLFTRLTAGNIGNSFEDETGTREGRFAFDGLSGNNIVIDRLHYVFPVADTGVKVTAMAGLAAHHFYADVFNDGLNAGGGADNALSAFAERNPLYRQGIAASSTGLGLSYDVGDKLTLTAGYIAPNGSDPTDGNGIFNGSYSALGQIGIKPFEGLRFGVNYVRTFDTAAGGLFATTGTNLGNLDGLDGISGIALDGESSISNSVGGQFQWDVTSGISFRGWFGFTDVSVSGEGEGEILNYAGVLAFPDLGKEGNLGAIIVGAEPYLTGFDLEDGGEADFEDDVPFRVEAFYKYRVNSNISITPGVIWLSAPNQDNDNSDIFIGALRTTFKF